MILHPGKRITMKLTFELERPVELAYLRSFIADALECWGGQKHPADELFGSLERVNATLLREKRVSKEKTR